MSLYKCVNSKILDFRHLIFIQSSRDYKHVSKKVIRIQKKTKNAPQLTETLPEQSHEPISEKLLDLPKDQLSKNATNLQMLSDKLYQQIFGSTPRALHSAKEIKEIREELEKFGCDVKKSSELPDVDLTIPNLEGSNLTEHFFNIAQAQAQPYRAAINDLLTQVPPMPSKFLMTPGWTRYTESGDPEPVEFPKENGLIFDVEICMKEGPLPVMATAVSSTAWYGWVSQSLVQGSANFKSNQLYSPEQLIPLESSSSDTGSKLNKHQKKPKIVVGHNVGFDRIRIKEQYWLNSTGTRFLDTMALHICVSGTSSYQRAILKSKSLEFSDEKLNSLCSLNNLADVYKLYCGKKLSKSARDVFVEGDLEEIKKKFDDLMTYCASDVLATQRILGKLFTLYEERFPHPASLAGMLELGLSYLPVNGSWTRYIEEAESIYNDLNLETKVCLARRADEVCKLHQNEKYKQDLWMWDQDWSVQDIKLRKKIPKDCLNTTQEIPEPEEDEDPEIIKLKKKFEYLESTKHLLPKRIPFMPGYPNWYRKLCRREEDPSDDNWLPGAQNISTSMQVVPKLLNLTWENHPLHYIKEHGWGFLVPCESDIVENFRLSDSKVISEAGRIIILNDDLEKQLKSLSAEDKSEPESDEQKYFLFVKLPHKDGAAFNVGNPLAKDFLSKFSENVISGDSNASRILQISNTISYWKMNRDRILSQVVVWLNNGSKTSSRTGAILPLVLVAGTLTRRAVEPTWMTASRAHPDRVGSELRAIIQAPPGYCIIGADVDSQELWLASIIGDAFARKSQGSTPFSWMTLDGSKSRGTDMHSITAKSIGINRDQAKIINYARIYGAGPRFADRLLKQFNPTMTNVQTAAKAKKMFQMTKGKKFYRLKSYFLNEENDFEDRLYTPSEAMNLAKLHNKPLNYVFERGRWYGGSESAMFNSLEEIVEQKEPATPFLGARLSRALEHEPDYKNLPTKVNWVVQSGAVDFLHLMFVCMRWLMKDKARFVLSFHDEVRYLVPQKYKYEAALAMHVTNLLVRSFCVEKLGMSDLPASVAFFTGVDVDQALRKEADHDYRTPSNPHGLEVGYGIKNGETLDVWQAIEKSNGRVGLVGVKEEEKDN